MPGASDSTFRAALVAAALIAVLNAVLPPLVAALRLPFTALLGFFGVLFLDAGMLLLADRVSSGLSIDSFWSALGVALAAAAVGVVLSISSARTTTTSTRCASCSASRGARASGS